MPRPALRPRGAPVTILAALSLLVIVWATLAPRGGDAIGTAAVRFCYWCGPARVTDALANVALFVPLGAALVFSGLSVRGALIGCLLFTLCIETSQSLGMPAGRIASAADILTNLMGATLGAVAARWRAALLMPTRRMAVVLSGSWSAICCGVFLATAWGMSAPQATSSTSPVQSAAGSREVAAWSPSTLPFTPGFGWFEGRVIGVLVNDNEFLPKGTGPMIVVGPAQDRYFAHLVIVGADRRTEAVPMLFVHTPVDMSPELLVSQHGSSLMLRARSRAADAGMAPLDLLAPRAFDRHEVTNTDTTTISARTSGRELSLTVERGALRWQGALQRTPFTGWALVQSLVPVGSEYSAMFTSAWLVLLLLPLGFWGWWSREFRAYVLFAGTVAIGSAISAGIGAFHIAFPPVWQWYAALAALAAGMLLGRVSSFQEHRSNVRAG